MSVCLCDTNKKEVDIHINDCLRNQGLAIFDPDSVEDEKDYDGYQLESSTLMVSCVPMYRLVGFFCCGKNFANFFLNCFPLVKI